MRAKKQFLEARSICNVDMKEYGLIWERVLKKQLSAIVTMEELIASVQGTLPVMEPSQPELEGAHCTDVDYLVLLNMEFEEHDDTLFLEAEAVAAEMKFEFHKGPSKKDERCMEKAELSYQDNFARLKDLRRASIVCATVDEICLLIPALQSRLTLLRVKNRFRRDFDANNESAGYRDLQFNVQVPGTKLIRELQVHLADIEEFKTKNRDVADASGRTGHNRYVAFRAIKERLGKKE